MPNALALLATCRPTPPSPSMPSVFPAVSCPSVDTPSSREGRDRRRDRSRRIVKSAVAALPDVGALDTDISRDVQALVLIWE